MRRLRLSRKRMVALLVLALVAAGSLVAALGGNPLEPRPVDLGGVAGAPQMREEASRRALGGGSAATADAKAVAPDGGVTYSDPAPSISGSPLPPPEPPGAGTVVPGAPRVVRTGELRLEVPRGGFNAAFDRVASIASTHGGFVASSSTSSSRDEDDREVRFGELSVRVPADRFDAARQALSGLGELEGQSIRGEDVSGQLVDYEARLRSLTAQEDALRTLLARAGAVGEVLQVQSSLFSVRQQIEQLAAQRAELEQRAALATISISLYEPGALPEIRPPEPPPTSLANSFRRAVEGALTVVGGMIVVVGWLAPLVALGLVVWVLGRLGGKGRRVREAGSEA